MRWFSGPASRQVGCCALALVAIPALWGSPAAAQGQIDRLSAKGYYSRLLLTGTDIATVLTGKYQGIGFHIWRTRGDARTIITVPLEFGTLQSIEISGSRTGEPSPGTFTSSAVSMTSSVGKYPGDRLAEKHKQDADGSCTTTLSKDGSYVRTLECKVTGKDLSLDLAFTGTGMLPQPLPSHSH